MVALSRAVLESELVRAAEAALEAEDAALPARAVELAGLVLEADRDDAIDRTEADG